MLTAGHKKIKGIKNYSDLAIIYHFCQGPCFYCSLIHTILDLYKMLGPQEGEPVWLPQAEPCWASWAKALCLVVGPGWGPSNDLSKVIWIFYLGLGLACHQGPICLGRHYLGKISPGQGEMFRTGPTGSQPRALYILADMGTPQHPPPEELEEVADEGLGIIA